MWTFRKKSSAKIFYEFLVFPKVAEKITAAPCFCYSLLELQSFVLRKIKD